MASLDFPASPSDLDEFTSGDTTWQYNATKGYWTVITNGVAGPTGFTGSIGFTGSAGTTGFTGSAGVTSIVDNGDATAITIGSDETVTFAKAIQENVYTNASVGSTFTLDPSNGTIQNLTLSASSTFSDSLASGEYITLHILDGTAYTITWPTMEWIGGTAPTLDTTNETIINIWKVSTVLYGALVGVSS